MPSSPDRNSNPNPSPNPQAQLPPPVSKKRTTSWPEFWFKDQRAQALNHAFHKMRLHSLCTTTTPSSEPEETQTQYELEQHNPNPLQPGRPDYTAQLSDELLLIILSKLPEVQHVPDSLVCKRWFRISGGLVKSVRLLEWEFLDSGRVLTRFPNLIDVDVVRACVKSPKNSGILLSHRFVSVHVNSGNGGRGGFFRREDLVDSGAIDRGIRVLSEGYLGLRRLVLVNVSEEGLKCVARECCTLQELELHCCSDLALRGISGCENLQILKLICCGVGYGFYNEGVISDIGLTILAQGCKRLVKVELVGCEGSYDGIKAIGQCCQMLEELSLCDHRMEGGWLAGLSYCGNLKTLKLQSCKSVDLSPGPDEHLGSCPTLEELHLQQCQLRDNQGVRALFLVCRDVRELVFEDCWGLDNSIFAAACICRTVSLLSLEGCSLLTIEGLESVVLSWNVLHRLRVVSCNNIKDSEVTPALAALFSVLKELKWRPDSRSLLSSGLAGTGVGRKGGRAFKRK